VSAIRRPPPPARAGDRPTFIGQGEAVYKCAALFWLRVEAWRIVLEELMAVLANLASIRRHGVPCSRPRAASTVVMWGFPVWSPPAR
jgi:hypothetical protein